jgi:hypothetical protein
VRNFGKLLATFANPIAGPQTVYRAVRERSSSAESLKHFPWSLFAASNPCMS